MAARPALPPDELQKWTFLVLLRGSVRAERIRLPIPLMCVCVSVRSSFFVILGLFRVVMGKSYRDLNEPEGWRSSSFRNILLFFG